MFVLCLSVAEAREVYRWVAPDGTVNYADEPRPGATRILLPEWVPPKIIRPMAPPLTLPREDKPKPGGYKQLAITSPAPEENIRDNQGIVSVSVKVSPRLVTAKGHQIQLLLDGQARGEPSPALRQSFKDVERGEHTVAAQVLDRNDLVLMTSEPVVFYLKHYSPLFYPPSSDVPPPPTSKPTDQPTPPNYIGSRPDQAKRAPIPVKPPTPPPPSPSPGHTAVPRAKHSPFRPYTPPPSGSGTP